MKQVFLIIILLVLIGCDGHSKTNTKSTIDKMKTFDIEKFEENKGKQGYVNEYHYELTDGSDVREFSSKAASDNFELRYQREFTNKFKPLNSVFTYYGNGALCTSAFFFNNSHIGKYKVFDKSGKLLREIDDDKSFKHTFEQIREIVLKEKKWISMIQGKP